jgi:hypothetical protein
VPQNIDLGTENIARNVQRIVIAVRTRQDDDAEFHSGGSLARGGM